MEFHTKLRDYRVRARVSQEDLGEIVGVSQNQVSRWERGVNVPDIRQAAAIASRLGLSLDHLLDAGQGLLSDEDLEMRRRVVATIGDVGFREAWRRLVGAPAGDVARVIEPAVVVPGRGAKRDQKGAG